MHEFTALLAEAGFGAITVSTEYDPERVPDPESGMWTFHATRF